MFSSSLRHMCTSQDVFHQRIQKWRPDAENGALFLTGFPDKKEAWWSHQRRVRNKTQSDSLFHILLQSSPLSFALWAHSILQCQIKTHWLCCNATFSGWAPGIFATVDNTIVLICFRITRLDLESGVYLQTCGCSFKDIFRGRSRARIHIYKRDFD